MAGKRETEAPASLGRSSTSSLCPCFHRTSRTRLLWRRTFSATVVGTPFLFGAHYFMAEASERRKLRLAIDGIGRFGRSEGKASPAIGWVGWPSPYPCPQGMHVGRSGDNAKSSPKLVLTKPSTDFTRSAMALKARAPALDIEKLPLPYHPGRYGVSVMELGNCHLTSSTVGKGFCNVPSSPSVGIPLADSPASLGLVNEKSLININILLTWLTREALTLMSLTWWRSGSHGAGWHLALDTAASLSRIHLLRKGLGP